MSTEIAQPTTRFFSRPSAKARRLALPLGLCVLTIAAVMPALLSAPNGTRVLALPVFLVGAGVTFAVALGDLVNGRDLRFAWALLGAGMLWSLSAFAASREPALYAIGRVTEWFLALAITYLVLSYPSGRLTGRIDRLLFGCTALVAVLLFLPTALVAHQFPNPSLWSSCTIGCPANPLALGRSTPALVPNVIVPLREALTALLLAVVAGVAVQRARNGRALSGRMCAPVALIAVAQVLTLAVYFRVRASSATAPGLEVLSWIYVMSLPAIALAAAGGRLYRRLFAIKALDRIAHDLRAGATPAGVRRLMANALEDPSLRVLHSFPGDPAQWVDESGSPFDIGCRARDQIITEVASGEWRLALLHDAALAEDPALLETAGAYALAALENDELSAQLRASREELAQARILGITAERRGRRKIERDIHDGAQQRLVALRVKLALAAEQFGGRDAAAASALRRLADDVDATIDDVRSFASGVYPALLAETGLATALRTLARGTTLPTIVSAQGLRRYPREVETTIYFSCSEALQNAVKHAPDATEVTIRVWDDGDLKFEVSDNGCGFDLPDTPYGTGLSGLNDRLIAVGGSIRIRSAPGEGTTVGGTIPRAGAALGRLTQVP